MNVKAHPVTSGWATRERVPFRQNPAGHSTTIRKRTTTATDLARNPAGPAVADDRM